jgi:hypothetical protein
MDGYDLPNEEVYLIEAFRRLKPEARYTIVSEARSALSREETARQRYTEQRDTTGVPQPGSSAGETVPVCQEQVMGENGARRRTAGSEISPAIIL